jgi:hypothetical protein
VIRRAGDHFEDERIVLGSDPSAKGHTWRSVEALAHGSSQQMQALIGQRVLPGRFVGGDDGIDRRWRRDRDQTRYPSTEEFYVAAPEGIQDKQRGRFEQVWRHALAERRTAHRRAAAPRTAQAQLDRVARQAA